MMSAADNTAPPIVWARSTGLEVLNELDAFKAGILVTGGVETVVGGAQVAQSVGSGLKLAARRVLQQLLTASVPGANRITR
ncbi:hypothetical protein BGW80DRAFT_1361943, partial [Lactifluus volemus]